MIWQVAEIETRKRTLRLTEVGMMDCEATALIADGVVLANIVERTAWSQASFQTLICETCACEGCEPGSRLSVRHVGDGVLFIPAFEAMMVDETGAEARAPDYAKSKGLPLLSAQHYESLLELLPGLPWEPAKLTGFEAACLVQWEAPASALGKFPSPPKLQDDLLLAVADGNLDETRQHLHEALAILCADTVRLVELAEPSACTLYLDGPRTPEWRALAYAKAHKGHPTRPEWRALAHRESTALMYLEPGWGLVPVVP